METYRKVSVVYCGSQTEYKSCKYKSAETEAQARRHVYRVQLQVGDSKEKIMRLTSDSESMITGRLNELEVHSPVKTL